MIRNLSCTAWVVMSSSCNSTSNLYIYLWNRILLLWHFSQPPLMVVTIPWGCKSLVWNVTTFLIKGHNNLANFQKFLHGKFIQNTSNKVDYVPVCWVWILHVIKCVTVQLLILSFILICSAYNRFILIYVLAVSISQYETMSAHERYWMWPYHMLQIIM